MRSTTRRLSSVTDRQIDLNEFAGGDGFLFVRDGVGVAGRGVAARADKNQIEKILREISDQNTSSVAGSGPIAIGCIPFVGCDPHEFAIPRIVIGKTSSGEQWISQIGEDDFDLATSTNSTVKPNAASFSVNPGVPVERYLEAVRCTAQAVKEGRLEKAVIARDIFVSADKPFDIGAVLLRLKASFGSSYRYSIDGLIGASPELLVAVAGNQVTSHPLAGTAPRSGNQVTDAKVAEELLSSAKNQVEHRIVIDMVRDTLLPWCSFLDWQAEPSIVSVANVQHLGTEISGQLSEPRPSVLELAYALSPTPALGGAPREAALHQIAAVEGMSRGRYGGAVGYFNACGDGTFAVAIRCAEFDSSRKTARLFAGGGIVADSEPETELAETQAKFQAMLAALIRP
ncbi:MAG: isochorismate synthase [Actinobacteria bacterium]|nr:isochorismate synthase [Actinomycetota bacterium]